MSIKGPRGVELLQGETITLAAAAARTAGASGTGLYVGGERKRINVLLSVTASAHEAGDTLDVYVDVSLDDVTYLNAIHFAQQAGDGAAKKEFGVLDPTNPGAVTILATSDALAGVVRPGLFGPYIRARWAIVDSGDADSSHTFSVVAWAE